MKPKTPPPPGHLSAASRRDWTAILGQWDLGPAELLTLEGGFEAKDLARRLWREIEAARQLTLETGPAMQRANPLLKAYLDAARESRLAFASLRLDMPEAHPASKWPTIRKGVA